MAPGVFSMGLAGLKDIQDHIVKNQSAAAGLTEWTAIAKSHGFGPLLSGIALSNVILTRDSYDIGQLGLTKNKKAVIVSPLNVESFDEANHQLDPYYLAWQKRLLESNFLKAGFGWFAQDGKIYLVRELLSGHSIQRFHATHSEAFNHKPFFQYLQTVEKILSKETEFDDELGHFQLIPLRFEEWQQSKKWSKDTPPISQTAVLRFLGQLHWVFQSNGQVYIEGLNKFIQFMPEISAQNFDEWCSRHGADSYQVLIKNPKKDPFFFNCLN